MRTATLALILGSAIAVGIACGGRQNPELARQDKRTEIIALWTQIRDWRLEAGMPLDPPADTLMSVKNLTVERAQRVCEVQVPASCNDVCNLGDAICDNAERICDIATELGSDDKLGQEKCQSAKASCRDAKQRCCKCSSDSTKAAAFK